MSSPHTSPGRGQAFGGTLEVVRCSAYAIECQPGTMSREGDKSLEAVPLHMVDVQHAMQSCRGGGIIAARACRPFPVLNCLAPRSRVTLAGVRGFRFLRRCGAKTPAHHIPAMRYCQRQHQPTASASTVQPDGCSLSPTSPKPLIHTA